MAAEAWNDALASTHGVCKSSCAAVALFSAAPSPAIRTPKYGRPVSWALGVRLRVVVVLSGGYLQVIVLFEAARVVLSKQEVCCCESGFQLPVFNTCFQKLRTLVARDGLLQQQRPISHHAGGSEERVSNACGNHVPSLYCTDSSSKL